MFLGKDLMDTTMEDWNRLVAVNLMGVWLGTKVCAPALAAADKGYEFLFVLGVPKITGAVQGIINPIAIR